MQIQIDGLIIAIAKIDPIRVLFVGKRQIPYFMAWDKATMVWRFSDSNIPFELQVYEMELSDFIVKSEQELC